MSVDLNAELNAFRAMIVTLKDDIIRQRDAVSISSINTYNCRKSSITSITYVIHSIIQVHSSMLVMHIKHIWFGFFA